MRCAPALAAFQRTISLPDRTEIFLYDSAGDGPPLILLHGLQDEADTWRHIYGELAAQYRVIAPDLPGFGRSDKRPRAFGVPFYSGCVMALAAGLGLDRFGLIGNSLGAITADAVAAQHPDRVSALVLLNGSLVISHPPASRLSLFSGSFSTTSIADTFARSAQAHPKPLLRHSARTMRILTRCHWRIVSSCWSGSSPGCGMSRSGWPRLRSKRAACHTF